MSTELGTYLGTSLGTPLGTEGGDAGELAALEFYLARVLFSWIRADYRTLVDYGGGDVRVSAFPDKVELPTAENGIAPNARSVDANHAFSQATQANQAPAPAPNAALLGQLASQFASDWYDSTLPAANWKFLHDGSGFESWHIHVTGAANSTTFATFSLNPVNVGIHASYAASLSPPTVSTGMTIGEGDGSNSQLLGQRLFTTGTAHCFNQIFATSRTPDMAVFDGAVSVVSGDAASPSSANPLATLRLGASTSGTFPADYAFADLMIANKVDASLRAYAARYRLLRYGLT